MVIKIKGYDVQIDEEDYERIMKHKWRVKKNELRKGLVYFRTGYTECITMHRFILNLHKGIGIVDHKDGNTLNNKKENLRLVSVAQNNMNRKNNPNKYGLKGVKRNERSLRNPFIAVIQVNKKSIYLGAYPTAQEAHAAYCEASKKYHGEFGRTE